MSHQSVLKGNTHHPQRFTSRALTAIQYVAIGLLLTMAADVRPVLGQSLNWEGQTGVFVTPLAYTAASSKDGFGKPIVAFHFLNGGKVLGNFYHGVTHGGRSGPHRIRLHPRFAFAGKHGGPQQLMGQRF